MAEELQSHITVGIENMSLHIHFRAGLLHFAVGEVERDQNSHGFYRCGQDLRPCVRGLCCIDAQSAEVESCQGLGDERFREYAESNLFRVIQSVICMIILW